MDRRRRWGAVPVRAGPDAVDAGLWDGVAVMETEKLEALLGRLNANVENPTYAQIDDKWDSLNELRSMGADLAAEVLRLRAENAQLVAANQALVADAARMREALEDIARQRLQSEMTVPERAYADWHIGYDMCVGTARAALKGGAA